MSIPDRNPIASDAIPTQSRHDPAWCRTCRQPVGTTPRCPACVRYNIKWRATFVARRKRDDCGWDELESLANDLYPVRPMHLTRAVRIG